MNSFYIHTEDNLKIHTILVLPLMMIFMQLDILHEEQGNHRLLPFWSRQFFTPYSDDSSQCQCQ